jgi:predicted Zn-dependent protease
MACVARFSLRNAFAYRVEPAMKKPFTNCSNYQAMSRRDLLRFFTAASVSTCLPFVGGCAVATKEDTAPTPRERALRIDREQAPHQFSADYGIIAHGEINAYLNTIGQQLARHAQWAEMPYSFQAVNATHLNTYAFPAGSIAITRGLLVNIGNEAELAALLSHEIGHVNIRHAIAKTHSHHSMPADIALAGVGAALAAEDYRQYASSTGALDAIASGALLPHHGLEDENKADALGMHYLAHAGYSPGAMVKLLTLLRRQSEQTPLELELMFTTHQMSRQRDRAAQQQSAAHDAEKKENPVFRERYMDNMVTLRSMKPAFDEMQKGTRQMRASHYQEAERHFSRALRYAPEDYAALLMMCKCQIGLEQPRRSRHYAQQAMQVNPGEAQAHYLDGIALLMQKKFLAASDALEYYEKRLPGNPNGVFLNAIALEGSGNKKSAARQYYRYLQSIPQGEQSEYAYQRLKAWGYLH